MVKPVWFLDVDGVVNADPAYADRDNFKTAVITDDSRTPTRSFIVYWQPFVVDFINYIADNDLAKIIWLTDWRDLANTGLAPTIGINHVFEVDETVGPSSIADSTNWWKTKAIEKFLHYHPAAPIIFTDDFLTKKVRIILEAYPNDKLLLKPNMYCGLQESALQQILEFCLKHQ